MTIKYSPELKLNHDRWVAANGTVWSCSTVERYWEISGRRRCWIAASDKPVRGALKYDTRGVRFSREGLIYRDGQARPSMYAFNDLLREFNSPTIWVWIEVPA